VQGRAAPAGKRKEIVMLKACLNGARDRSEHPRCPVTADELASDGAAAVAAGAAALHVHPRDAHGGETLDHAAVAAALLAMRDRLAVPIGISTGAWFAPDPADRLRAIRTWTVVPDFASVNFHEAGATQVAEALLDRGVGVEAGIWTPDAATVLSGSALAGRCLRILLEPMEQDLAAALTTVKGIENRLEGGAPGVPRLLHGFELTVWPMIDHAAARGYDTRVGLEDTLARPDGTTADDNADLVRAATERLRRSGPV
jgi:uncharacterized protein (DUF849 family)